MRDHVILIGDQAYVLMAFPENFDLRATGAWHQMADLKRAEKHKDNFEKSIRIIADLAEVSSKVVEGLDAADFAAVSAAVGEFMGVSDASA